MASPPFMPPTFKDTKPKGGWNTYTGPQEDGPGFFTNPANSGLLVAYAGANQTSIINAAYLPPPVSPAKCRLPGAAVGMSKIP